VLGPSPGSPRPPGPIARPGRPPAGRPPAPADHPPRVPRPRRALAPCSLAARPARPVPACPGLSPGLPRPGLPPGCRSRRHRECCRAGLQGGSAGPCPAHRLGSWAFRLRLPEAAAVTRRFQRAIATALVKRDRKPSPTRTNRTEPAGSALLAGHDRPSLPVIASAPGPSAAAPVSWGARLPDLSRS